MFEKHIFWIAGWGYLWLWSQAVMAVMLNFRSCPWVLSGLVWTFVSFFSNNERQGLKFNITQRPDSIAIAIDNLILQELFLKPVVIFGHPSITMWRACWKEIEYIKPLAINKTITPLALLFTGGLLPAIHSSEWRKAGAHSTYRSRGCIWSRRSTFHSPNFRQMTRVWLWWILSQCIS